MKQSIISLSFLMVLGGASAQDTTRLNAGYLTLKQEYTQTITIKGSDLEKMPFANLSEAIASWAFGAYTQPAGLTYIVDGNTVSDVNAYSVYDIDEVVVVLNAAALATTASGQQELVLVRTKRPRGKSGLEAAVQGGLVNVSGYQATARWYQNIYVGGYRNWDKVSIGVSANYLRDVFPDTVQGHTNVNPEEWQRWRLNGYFDWRVNKSNLVELTVNYTPQKLAEAWDSVFQPSDTRNSTTGRQHLVVPHFRWHSDLVSGLTNDLQATYLHGGYSATAYQSAPSFDAQSGDAFQSNSDHSTSYHLLFWDRLAYRGKIGSVDVEPALNASYEYSREKDSASGYSGDEPNSAGMGTRMIYTAYYNTFTLDPKFLFLTPSIDFSFKRAFDFQGGVLVEAGHQHGPGNRQGFPFASLMIDPLRMVKEKGGTSLRLFGSYAERTESSVVGYTLADLTDGATVTGLQNAYFPTSGNFGTTGGPIYTGAQKPPAYWVWETGVSFSGWKDRLLIQYNFERRNYSTEVIIPSYQYDVVVFPEVKAELHHVDIRVKVLDESGVKWQSGLNITLLRNKVGLQNVDEIPIVATGDVAPSGWSETGGWVNRIQVKGFTAGVDLLYHFGETMILPLYPGNTFEIKRGGKQNSVLVPNIYAGYGWKAGSLGMLEFFVESRGAIRNSPNDLSDGRRFYTVGGKLSI